MVNVILKNVSTNALQYAANAIKTHRPSTNPQGAPPTSDDILMMHGLIQEAVLKIASPMLEAVNNELRQKRVEGNIERAAEEKGTAPAQAASAPKRSRKKKNLSGPATAGKAGAE